MPVDDRRLLLSNVVVPIWAIAKRSVHRCYAREDGRPTRILVLGDVQTILRLSVYWIPKLAQWASNKVQK